MDNGKFITVNQAMEIFHLGRRTIRKRMDEIGATVKVGKRVLFDTDIIQKKYGDIRVVVKGPEECVGYVAPFIASYAIAKFELKDGKIDDETFAYIMALLVTRCKTMYDCFDAIDILLHQLTDLNGEHDVLDFIKAIREMESNG